MHKYTPARILLDQRSPYRSVLAVLMRGSSKVDGHEAHVAHLIGGVACYFRGQCHFACGCGLVKIVGGSSRFARWAC